MNEKDVLAGDSTNKTDGKMENTPTMVSVGKDKNTTLIPSDLLGIILAESIHTNLLGNESEQFLVVY